MTDKIVDLSGRLRAKGGEEGPKFDFAFTTGMMLKDAHGQSRIAKLKHLAAEEEPGSAS